MQKSKSSLISLPPCQPNPPGLLVDHGIIVPAQTSVTLGTQKKMRGRSIGSKNKKTKKTADKEEPIPNVTTVPKPPILVLKAMRCFRFYVLVS